MEIAKALILAGSSGLEAGPWPSAPATPRHLFPVANRPILFHNLERLRKAGILAAEILAGPDTVGAISDAIGRGPDFGLMVRCTEQDPDADLGGALAARERFIGDEPVLVQRGDALLREGMSGPITTFAREGLDAMALRLGVGARGPMPVPAYLLSTRAIAILLGDAGDATSPLDRVGAGGGRVRVCDVQGVLGCAGDEAALLDSNRAVLEALVPSPRPLELVDCQVQGPVEVHPTALVERSVLRGPLVIGAGARIADSYIGPYSAIGEDVEAEGVEIEHSIVLAGARLQFVGTRIESSVIGRGARVTRSFRLPAALRLSLGEGAEVVLS